MNANSTPPNRLRPHFQRHQEEQPRKRYQRDIVCDFREDIIGLIKDDGAGLADVIAAVAAQGEAVLAAGFKAEILAQIGTVKDIRAGRAKRAEARGIAATNAHPVSVPNRVDLAPADDDDDFTARRPRS